MTHKLAAAALLVFMGVLAGGAALRESPTFDEYTHVGAGLSYVQKLDMRMNPEHPPLAKILAAVPLAVGGARADYESPSWTVSNSIIMAYTAQWMFGDAVLGRWNPWRPTILWARVPMLLLTLLLGWVIYIYASRIGGPWGGLLCLTLYVGTPSFLAFGPMVLTDVAATLFTLITLWQLGELWQDPTRGNVLRFGLALGAAVLSKFTALILVVVIGALFLYTKFRLPWRAVLRGMVWAALLVYAVYFVFSWNQPNDALGTWGGHWLDPIRRILMPPWIYLRGVGFMLFFSSRPTYLFGHIYSHGVPFYFPVVMAFKSPLGFLLLLALAAALAYRLRAAIPAALRPHCLVLLIGFAVFTLTCLASQLNISIRHFSIPHVLLILALAPLPRAIEGRRILRGAAASLAAGCLITVVTAYPLYIPYVNGLAMGRPVYTLLNGSNVDWNHALPEVAAFVKAHQLQRLRFDWLSLSDPAVIVPELEPWNCQEPKAEDAGQWVVLSATNIRENRNCGWIEKYPREELAGGSMYAFRLPERLPAVGEPGGPPAPKDRIVLLSAPFDIRGFSIDVERHPEKLEKALFEVMKPYL